MDCKARSNTEEIMKKPFYISEPVLWACDGGASEFPDPLFTRHESVLTQEKCSVRIPRIRRDRNKSKQFHKVSLRGKQKRMKKSGLVNEKANKRFKEDLYDMNNVVFFDTRVHAITSPTVNKQIAPPKIFIPDYKVVDYAFYKEVDENEMLENDDEVYYEEMHRAYELAENCNKFLDCGQGLPEELKGGLKIKIKLPSNSNELPSLI